MALSLSPKIHAFDQQIISKIKTWGWKVYKGKTHYKKFEVEIDYSPENSQFWVIKFHDEIGIKEWKLLPLQVKQSLDHLICVASKTTSHLTIDTKNIRQKKRYFDQAQLKMGKVIFPLSFWLDISHVQSVHELLGKLFALPVFLSNAYLLLCVLKKGESLATIYDYSRGRALKKVNLESDKFNAIFEHVKKNKKGYLFNMSNLSAYLKVQGYALGGSATSANYQVVFLVSKNELIPPTIDEINAIKSLLPELIPWIEHVMNIESQKHEALIFEVISKLLPINIELSIENQDSREKWIGALKDLHKNLLVWQKSKIKLLNLSTQSSTDETYLDLYHYQRVKLLGELFNTLKHELSNPLFGLKLSQQLLLPRMNDPQINQLWKNIEINVNRCEQILNSTLDLYGDKNVNQEFELEGVVNQALLLSKSRTKGIIIESEFSNMPKLKGDASLILHIVFNLLINAAEHLQTKKEASQNFIERIRVIGRKNNDMYELIVADNGDGVAPEIQGQLFQKFVTSKAQGTGLGLSLSHKLAQKIPGELCFLGNGLILQGAHFILRIKL